MFVCDICIDICWSGSFKPKKQKKQGFFGHFAMCRGHGTRQSDRMGRPGTRLCRVPKLSTRQSDHTSPCAPGVAHGEAARWAVCLLSRHTAKPRALSCACCPDTRRSLDLHRVSTAPAHGEQPPTPSTGRDGVCLFFRHVSTYTHGV